MTAYLAQPAFLLLVLFSIYWLLLNWRRRTGWLWINPVLFGTAAMIVYLKALGIDYPAFERAGRLISFWLQPAVVCLAVPLYQHWPKIRKQWLPIILSQLVGSIVGIASGVLFCYWFGASKAISMSLAAKSVTMPIALEVTKATGGIAAVAAAGVIIAGAFGQSFGYLLLHWGKIKNPISKALAHGTGSHAMGIAASLEISRQYAAYATVGLIFNGVLTSFLTPPILILMGFAHYS